MASSYSIEPPGVARQRGSAEPGAKHVPCPECRALIFATSKYCDTCGAIFTQRERTTHQITPLKTSAVESPSLIEGDVNQAPNEELRSQTSLRNRTSRAIKSEYQRAWLQGFWSGILLPFAFLVPVVAGFLDQSNPNPASRRRGKGLLLGFAVGFALLVVLALLLWVAWSAFHLQEDFHEAGKQVLRGSASLLNSWS